MSIEPLPIPVHNIEENLIPNEPKYDPNIHLDLKFPEFITTIDTETQLFETVRYIDYKLKKTHKFLYTTPFRVLSEEGQKFLKKLAALDGAKHAQSDNRMPLFLRNLAFRSQFIRDLNHCPVLLKFISNLIGEQIIPHSMPCNYAHTNFGIVGGDRKVDQWHVDSVPFVLILLLTDLTNAVGGELQIVTKPKEIALDILQRTDRDRNIQNVGFRVMGDGVVMQGCEIFHCVTPVMKAPDTRITIVNSYMQANPFAVDTTKYATFKGDKTASAEYARHKAWRAKGQLDTLITDLDLNTDKTTIVTQLQNAINELQTAVDAITDKVDDGVGFIQDKVIKKVSSARDTALPTMNLN